MANLRFSSYVSYSHPAGGERKPPDPLHCTFADTLGHEQQSTHTQPGLPGTSAQAAGAEVTAMRATMRVIFIAAAAMGRRSSAWIRPGHASNLGRMWGPSPVIRRRELTTMGSPADQPTEGCGDHLVQKIRETLGNHRVSPGSLLMVCVSGGSDSVALLLLLCELNSSMNPPPYRIEILHFNHGLRPESTAEAQFVESLARRVQAPFHIRVLPPETVTAWKCESGGIQEKAREWRRHEAASLIRTLAEGGDVDGYMVTAHHADDDLETALMKLLRGVHISRIQGIECVSKPADIGVPVIRPLVSGISKEELQGFLQGRGQRWCEDASNLNLDYQRNSVRQTLIPVLEELAGGRQALLRRMEALTAQSSSLRDWLDREACHWESTNLGPSSKSFPLEPWFAVQGELLRTEILHRFLMRSIGSASIPFAHIQRVEAKLERDGTDPVRWSLHLPGAWSVRRIGKVLKCESKRSQQSKVLSATSWLWMQHGSTSDSSDPGTGSGEGDGVWIGISCLATKAMRDCGWTCNFKRVNRDESGGEANHGVVLRLNPGDVLQAREAI